jgi:hypothetical protein
LVFLGPYFFFAEKNVFVFGADFMFVELTPETNPTDLTDCPLPKTVLYNTLKLDTDVSVPFPKHQNTILLRGFFLGVTVLEH